MIQRAIIITDDKSPDEGDLAYMVMHADWTRRKADEVLFRLDILEYRFVVADDQTRPFYEKHFAKGHWRGDLAFEEFSLGSAVRLRTSGGCFPEFAHNWFRLQQADPGHKILPESFHDEGGGDWFVSNDSELVGDAFLRKPFIFTVQDGKQHPAVKKALRNMFEIGLECQPACAHWLKRFPPHMPFSDSLLKAHGPR